MPIAAFSSGDPSQYPYFSARLKSCCISSGVGGAGGLFGSEAAVRVITNLMQVVGVESYGHELPLAGLLQDAMALPLFAGGNIGVRRRQLHALMLDPAYDDLATLDGICLAETVP